MKKLIFITFTAVLGISVLNNCAINSIRQQRYLNGFIGLSRSELIQKIGKPQSESYIEGDHYLTYEKTKVIPQTVYKAPLFDESAFVGSSIYCYTNFFIIDAKVSSYEHHGSDRCYP
jgi:hypothetical protein